MNIEFGAVKEPSSSGYDDIFKNHFLKQILECIESGVAVLDDNFALIYCNNKYCDYMSLIRGNNNDQDTIRMLISKVRECDQKSYLYTHDCNNVDFRFVVGLVPFLVPMDQERVDIAYFLHFTPTQKDVMKNNNEMPSSDHCRISKREIEILSLMSKGYSNIEIADTLSMSIHTVKTHNENIFLKLHAVNRVSAVNKFLISKNFQR